MRKFRNRQKLAVAMSTVPLNRGRAFTAGLIAAAFLWTLALSVSPQLHERIHQDANRVEHTCAVTFVASSTYEHAAPPALMAPVAANTFAAIADVNPVWIVSAFLGASVFEHAPPVNS